MTHIPAFEYPQQPHQRKHGPFGYSQYESYRDWLRDEFCFRCVFCLRREQWGVLKGAFHIDHFVPQIADPNLATNYDNLLYLCSRCNLTKTRKQSIPNPGSFALGQALEVQDDGSIKDLNATGKLLIDLLNLDCPDLTRYRRWVLTTLRSLVADAPATYTDWLRFPDDLPNLDGRRKDQNCRPAGVPQSWFAVRRDGELPPVY